MTIRLLYVTNIPTPYRNKRFNVMQEVFGDAGIGLHVAFMAWTEPNRHWRFTGAEMRYDFHVHRGYHPTVAGLFAHVNPGLISTVARGRYDIIVIAGLASPSHWLATLAMRANAVKLLSVESNLSSVRRSTGAAYTFKRGLINQFDAYQVTGHRALDYITHFAPNARSKPAIVLPNLIDEGVFVDEVDAARPIAGNIRATYGVPPDTQLWVCPARLERVKGLHTFIPHLKGVPNVRLLVAGDGSLRRDLQALIDRHVLPVELIGHCSEADIVRLYAAADLFVLPSLSDPSPLSPIEAAAAGLPLLVSDRIGNAEDLIGRRTVPNGWSFNPEPERRSDIADLLREIASTPQSALRSMGEVSRAIYREHFDTRRNIERYAENLLGLVRQVRAGSQSGR